MNLENSQDFKHAYIFITFLYVNAINKQLYEEEKKAKHLKYKKMRLKDKFNNNLLNSFTFYIN